MRNVVRRRDDEHRRGLFRKPGEKRAEHARGRAAVGRAGALRAGERLVDFVHPQNRRRDRFGDGDGAAHIFLRRADEAAEHAAHVEAQQRQLPQAAKPLWRTDSFRNPARRACKMPFGAGKPKARASSVKAMARLLQPVLQHAQAADVAKSFVRRVVFEQAAFADDLLLLGEHFVDVIAAQPLVFHDDFGENIFRLAQRQAERGLQQAFPACVSRSIFTCLNCFTSSMILSSNAPRSSRVGSGKLRTVISFSSSVGNFHHRRNQDDRLETVLQVQRDFLELADDGEIVLREERMEILENKNRRLDLLDHLVERGQRIFGRGVAILLRLNRSPGRNDAVAVAPFENFLLPLAARSRRSRFCTRISSLEMM